MMTMTMMLVMITMMMMMMMMVVLLVVTFATGPATQSSAVSAPVCFTFIFFIIVVIDHHHYHSDFPFQSPKSILRPLCKTSHMFHKDVMIANQCVADQHCWWISCAPSTKQLLHSKSNFIRIRQRQLWKHVNKQMRQKVAGMYV